MNNSKSPFNTISKEKVVSTPIFDLYKEKVDCKNGELWDFFTIKCPFDWVNVVAIIPNNKLIITKQFRYGTKKCEFELPGGCIEKGEDPVVAGLRELEEETGYSFKVGKLIGKISPNPAIQDNVCYSVLVEGEYDIKDTNFDIAEDVETHLIDIEDVYNLIGSGDFTHSLGLSSLLYYKLHNRK